MDQQPLPLIEHPRRAKRAPKPPRPPKPSRDPHAPMPLRDARGVTRAWACVHCRRVSMPSTCFGPDAWRREAERSREAAATCCVCRDCGAVIDRAVNRWQSVCGACDARRDAAIAALMPAGPAPMMATWTFMGVSC